MTLNYFFAEWKLFFVLLCHNQEFWEIQTPESLIAILGHYVEQ